VRVSANPRVIPDARSPAEVLAVLGEMRRVAGHQFWSDEVSPAEDAGGFFGRAVGYRQVTDACLLTLAHLHGGRLATFDGGIVELAGSSSPDGVELIP